MTMVEQVRAAAAEAGRLALRHYGRASFELKSDQSVVTAADREVDAFLRGRLDQILPGAAYLGEESVAAGIAPTTAGTGPWLWVVDPIDGTAAFADGLDTFCVCVGLLRDGVPYAGVVCFPALRHEYWAEAGQGAWYDGRRVRVLAGEPVRDLAVLYVDAKAHLDYRVTYPGKTRSLGSTALHYLLVARGAGVGAVSTAHLWDYAAAAAVLCEAGGWVRHLDGREVDWLHWLDGRRIVPQVVGAAPGLWPGVAAGLAWTRG